MILGDSITQSGGYVAFIPPMDSMQEFRVQTNAYDASIGRQAGATLNMQTKSGTKNYHLVLYWFNQNNILNAKLFQTNLVNGVKPPVHFNEPGGTFGGPVWIPKVYDGRQKTFFFFSYDRTHTIDPRTGLYRAGPQGGVSEADRQVVQGVEVVRRRRPVHPALPGEPGRRSHGHSPLDA